MAGDHYIQQKYLHEFEIPDNPGSLAFWHRNNGTEVRTTGTRALCSEKDFYTTYEDDISKSRYVDEYLTKKLEPSLSAVLSRLHKNEVFGPEEIMTFSQYIVFKFYMVPSWRELHKHLSEKFLAHLNDRSQPNIWAKELFSTYLKEANLLAGMFWRVYTAPKGASFITSDNPVTCVNNPSGTYSKGSEGGVGGQLGARNNLIYFPLTKKHMLQIWGSIPSGFEYCTASKGRVSTYNKYTQMNCHNYLIGSNERLVSKYAKLAETSDQMTELKKVHTSQLLEDGLAKE